MSEQRAEARRVVAYIVAVGVPHQLERIGRRQRHAIGEPGPQRCNHGRLDRQRMNRDPGKAADRGSALFGTPKIKRALQTQGTQNLDIGLGEVAEMVGAEDLAPAHRPAIPNRIAPEVAEIAGAGKIEVAGRCIWHGRQSRKSCVAGKWPEGISLERLALVYNRHSKGANMNWRKTIIIFNAAALAA